MTITATGVGSCTIFTVSNVSFDYYGAALADRPGTLSITCTNEFPYSWYAEKNAGDLNNNGDILAYTLTFTDDTSVPVLADPLEGTGTGNAQETTIHVNVGAKPTYKVGAYTDIVTFTLTF
ncbi:MAG: hypothetical protein RBU45_19935 [Myxococcota bacterium]|jgi:spore coat protein U-like protein|nr:hypothetical protein [Myxococcota bacterium]